MDPDLSGWLRYWSGAAWTDWLSDGTTVVAGRRRARPLVPGDTAHLAFVVDVFLSEARATGLIDARQVDALSHLARTMSFEATQPRPERAMPVPRPHLTEAAFDFPVSAPVVEIPPARVRPLAAPGRLGRWWERTRTAVESDLAVNGLAYLGVLLLFVGVFGLVAFAFGDVAPNMRPVAELAIAAAPFLAATLLLRRRAAIAGHALELAGGLLLPIMFVTSFLDDVALPPDATGSALVVTLTVGLAAISASYAVWSWRHPASALRFLVAPVAWLAAGIATMGVGRPIPDGEDVASVTAVQVAVMSGAMVATFALARWHPNARLSGPTLTAGVSGSAVVGLLALLTWWAEGWPAPMIAVTGVLGLGVLDLLDVRLTRPVAAVLQPVWWAVVVMAMLPEGDAARVGVLGSVVFVAILENNGLRRPAVWPAGLAGAGAVGALALTLAEPWWTVALLTLLSVAAIARRLSPYAIEGAPGALDLAAAVLPGCAVMALGYAAGDAALATTVAAGIVVLATLPARRPLLCRRPEDRFWTRWWEAALPLVPTAAAVVWVQSDSLTTGQHWLLVGAVMALALAAAAGPLPAVLRPWPVIALGSWAWLMACHTATTPDFVRGGVLGLAGLLVVVAAHRVGLRLGEPVAGSLGLAGHALGAFALLTGGFGWGLVAVTGSATAGWMVTTWYDVRDRSPVGALLAGSKAWLRYLPPAATAAGLPATVAVALHVEGVVRFTDPWAPAVLAATAVLYAAATRRQLPDRVVTTLAWAGFGAGMLAAGLSWEVWPTVVGLTALVVAVPSLPARVRARPMVWVAWAAISPLSGLLATQWSSWFSGLAVQTAVSTTLVAVGGAMAVGAAAVDLRGRRWEPRWQPTHPALVPPLVVGGAETVVGLLVALAAAEPPVNGWLTAAGAVVVMAVALLARTGLLGGGALALGWSAGWLLAEDAFLDRPEVSLIATVALLAGAVVADRIVVDQRWWVRWDVPVFVVAHLTAATAVVAAADGDAQTLTWVGVGLLTLGAAGWLRRLTALAACYAGVGVLLVLAGAQLAGPGWLALALTGLSVALTLLAIRVRGSVQQGLAVVGALALLGAAQQGAVWLELTSQRTVDVVALGSALVAVVWALVVRWRPALRMWALAWGGVASLTVVGLAFLSSVAGVVATWNVAASEPIVVATAGLTLAWALAAAPVAVSRLRGGAVLLFLGAELEGAVVWEWSAQTQVTALAATSLSAALVMLGLRDRRSGDAWVRPVVGLGVVSALAGLAVAAGELPDLTLLTPTLLVAATQAAAAGVVVRSVGMRVLAPVLACGAWLAYTADALGGNAQWYSVPIGLALLVVVGLVRQDARVRGADPATPGIVGTELVGIGFLVGASFVQAVTESLAYTVLAVGLGLAVTAWGVVTKVRRRVVAGVLVVLAALVVLVGVPLVQMLPGWRGAGLWVLIAGAGLAALLVATLLEQGRSVVRRVLVGFGSATKGWE